MKQTLEITNTFFKTVTICAEKSPETDYSRATHKLTINLEGSVYELSASEATQLTKWLQFQGFIE